MNSMKNNKTCADKEFTSRNSILTDLSENKHIRTTYNLFAAILVGLSINTTVKSYVENNEITFGLKLIKVGFAKFHVTVITWSLYLLVSCLAFKVFIFWWKYRNFPKLIYVKIWDRSFLIMVFLYYLSSFKMAASIVSQFKLPIGSAAVILIEQVRFLMKFHSFVRNNAPKVLKKEDLKSPLFSNYFYFLFAPTLLYRDNYPRRETINWTFAFQRLLECAGAIFFLSVASESLLLPPLRDFGLRKYTIKELVVILFDNTITGTFILLAMFLVILHSSQNFFAEITRFGDRMFYSDWWTCTNYACYFRKWNIIVQDWLFVYVYNELKESLGVNVNAARLAVVFISAVVHEWLLASTLEFFFPVLFFKFFVLGSLFSSIKCRNPIMNVVLWYSLSLGMAIGIILYTMENYARINVPKVDETYTDVLLPRFLGYIE